MPSCKILLLEAGIVALGEQQDNVIESMRFEADSMARSYEEVKKSANVPGRLLQILDSLKSKGYLTCTTNDVSLARILSQHGMEASLLTGEQQAELQEKKVGIMLSANFAPNEFEATNLLRRFAIDLSSIKVSEVSARRDLHVIQCVNGLDELDKIVNTMSARVREWYGLQFPELDGMVQSLTAYCEIVSRGGTKENLDKALLEDIGMQEKSQSIINAARASKGGIITEENLRALQRIAEETRHLSVARDSLAKHLEQEMEVVAPNVKEILGATIGARIIARTGGLERLAVLPASTIQVIGAEKALFRALKSGARPPKHGIIFQHTLVHSAPRWQRGKIARAIAAKVAVAARIDAYKGSKEPSLLAKLNQRIDEIREKYKEPVEREERPMGEMGFRRREGEHPRLRGRRGGRRREERRRERGERWREERERRRGKKERGGRGRRR